MEFGLKDLFYIGGYVSTISMIWAKFSFNIKTNREDIEKLSTFFKKVILDDNGEIRLVDKVSFKEQKKELERSIIEGKQTTRQVEKNLTEMNKQVEKKLTEMNENIILLLYHFNVDSENAKGIKHV